jgi:hypothetical protein
MDKRKKKRKNYKRLREKRSSKRHNLNRESLEKLEKANHRRRLKVNIKLRLKKLIRLINLNSQYIGQ